MPDISDINSTQMVKITGSSSDGTEQTPVKSTTDGRLYVQNRIDPVPAQDVIYSIGNALNGSNKSMDVNGSSNAVNFDYIPGSGETIFIENISFMLEDGGTMDPSDFGAKSGQLNNGLQILIRSKGVEYEVSNLKDNMDIVNTFSSSFTPVSDDGGDIRGMLDNEDLYVGIMYFKTPIKLNDSDGDYVRIKVRDNLNALTQLECRVKSWRVI